MGFEQTVDNAVNGFAMWALQFEIIIGIICTSICFVVGCRYLKKGTGCFFINSNYPSARADHVHLCIELPPKYSVSGFMGYLKGKSAWMIFEGHPELKVRGDKKFWARGCM